MRMYSIPELEVEEEVSFKGIPDEQYEDVMSVLSHTLDHQMRQNEIQESQSIEYAATFITTV